MTKMLLSVFANALEAAGHIQSAKAYCRFPTYAIPANFTLTAHWAAPSRMFRFPLDAAVEEAADDSLKTITLGLRHPDLASHPFVIHLEQLLGTTISREPVRNKYGVTNNHVEWWHAVDLMTDEHHQTLLSTANFTRTEHLFAAIGHARHYAPHDQTGRDGYLANATARQLLLQLGSTPPSRSADILSYLSDPAPLTNDGKTHWPVNRRRGATHEEMAWAFVIGFEEGWIQRDRAGFANWSKAGRERASGGDSASYVQSNGQSAFAF